MGQAVTPFITLMDLSDPAQAGAVDAYVMAHADGTPFHRPAWLLAVEKGTANPALILAAVGHSGGISGLLPLHHVRSRLFGQAPVSPRRGGTCPSYCRPPGGDQPLGGTACSDAAIRAMLPVAGGSSSDSRAKISDICPESASSACTSFGSNWLPAFSRK